LRTITSHIVDWFATMLVVVKTLIGTNVELEVDPTDTLLHLKELITNKTG